MKKIKASDIVIGHVVPGSVLETGELNPFTWGTPWTVTSITPEHFNDIDWLLVELVNKDGQDTTLLFPQNGEAFVDNDVDTLASST